MRTLRLAALLLACAVPLGTTGCATTVAGWIVHERNHQGDVALAHRNYPDASVAYQLALKIDPKNQHARDGLINVQLRLAQTFFAASKFDDAIDALAVASRYAPADDRVQSMRGEIEQAEIK
ncbi:MAG TPA: tetratricopeptide repeat protein, partial [Candidatus Elarobacter sp.]|nr:tetratricopeptide repeat protein [Candidatus Elarobacter sp.]